MLKTNNVEKDYWKEMVMKCLIAHAKED